MENKPDIVGPQKKERTAQAAIQYLLEEEPTEEAIKEMLRRFGFSDMDLLEKTQEMLEQPDMLQEAAARKITRFLAFFSKRYQKAVVPKNTLSMQDQQNRLRKLETLLKARLGL